MTTATSPAERIAAAWKEALGVWDVQVSLSPPEPWSGKAKSHWDSEEPLAYIDLETRQVVVNFGLLERMDVVSGLPAVLAHEIGHHVRYPHTLGLVAELIVLEKRLLPGLAQSLTNLFFDLLVNQHVGRTHADELCAVYRGFRSQSKDEVSPLFAFYLAVYEELWGREPAELIGAAAANAIEKKYGGFRADARMFVQTFYALPTIHLQFVYFCSRFIRYIPDPEKLRFVIPMASDVPEPDADDFDAVLRGAGSEEGKDALEEAKKRGWIRDSGVQEGEQDEDPLTTIDKITRHRPGSGEAEFKQRLVSQHYKRLVDRYILKLPAAPPSPEPSLPSVVEEWEWGDNPRAIDWTASVLVQGPMAGVKPLRRDLLPDEPPAGEPDFPAVEIYLDTSGSMPDPARALNAMTLAAQILAASALRKNGSVRGIVYSSGRPVVSDWMYDEEYARRFLLNYAGGGTDYPFGLLREFSEERPDAIRVIISDSDFLWNVRQAGAMQKLTYGIEHSRLLVAFLAAPEADSREALTPVLRYPKLRLAVVKRLDDFGRAAAELAGAVLAR